MKQSFEIFQKSPTVWPPEAKNRQIEAVLEVSFFISMRFQVFFYKILQNYAKETNKAPKFSLLQLKTGFGGGGRIRGR